jgi:septal ring factor EnvC (AmiA/AmiB activator)
MKEDRLDKLESIRMALDYVLEYSEQDDIQEVAGAALKKIAEIKSRSIRPSWAEMEKQVGFVYPCSCQTYIQSYTELRRHWEMGHMDHSVENLRDDFRTIQQALASAESEIVTLRREKEAIEESRNRLRVDLAEAEEDLKENQQELKQHLSAARKLANEVVNHLYEKQDYTRVREMAQEFLKGQ